MKKAFWAVAALVVVALVLAAAIQLPAVRGYALRRAIALTEERLRIRLEATELLYDVIALRVEIRGLRATALPGGEPPFFTARRVSAQIPFSTLVDGLAISSLAIDDGVVRIVRLADGRTNLPATEGDPAATPAALRIGSLVANGLSIELIDRESRTAVILPALDLTMSEQAGRLYLREPGRLTRGDVGTRVHDVRGGIAFDGRTVSLANVTVRTDELTATFTGDVALLVEEPGLAVKFRAHADAGRLARWTGVAEQPAGQVNVRGQLEGAFDALRAGVSVGSPRLQYGSLVLSDLQGNATMSPESVRVERFVAAVAGGRVEATGDVPIRTGKARIEVAWEDVDLGAAAAMAQVSFTPRPTGRADGALKANGPLGELLAWEADGHLTATGGVTTRNRIGVDGRFDFGLHQGNWALEVPRPIQVAGISLRPALAGQLQREGLERSTIHGLVVLPSTDAEAVVDALRRVGVLTDDVPRIEGLLEARADISGRLARPLVDLTGKAEVADVAPLAQGMPLYGPAFIEVQSDLRAATISASLREVPALGEATVELRAPYAVKARVAAPGVSLERALAGIPTPVPIAGTVSASADATGFLSRWREAKVAVEIDSLDARVAGLPVRLESAARASIANRVADVAALDLVAGDIRVSAFGRLPLSDTAATGAADAMLITATGDFAQFLAAAAATRTIAIPDVTGTGPAALLARITGSLEQPVVSADLELGPGSVRAGDLPPVTSVSVRAHSDGAWIDLREAKAEWQGATISAEGRAPIAIHKGGAGTGELVATLTSITPRVLEPFVEPDTLAQIEGSIDASLQARSPSLALTDVTGEIRLDRMELRLADLPIAQRQPTRITVRDGFAEVQAWEWAGQGGTAGVEGRVRLADRAAALIANGRFDLRVLTPFTRAAGVTVAGTLEPRLSITGAVDAPRIDGVATLTDAEVRLRDPRVIATDLDGRMVMTGTTAQVTRLTGIVNGGELTGSGEVSYAPGEPIDASLSLAATGLALEFPEGLHSELNADVGLTLAVPSDAAEQPSGRLSGTVAVVRSSYREPISVAAGVLGALRTRRLAAEAAAGGARAPSLADTLTLDVRVTTEDADIVVDNNIGRLALAADLRVIGTAAAPALSGRAQLAEGGQLFLGRNRYEISSGTIDFADPLAIDPELDIVATTRAGGDDIELTITGRAEQPEIDARSLTDPGRSQADVISLLLTGRLLEEISGDEAEIVGEQALAFVSGDVLGFASRAVGLDVIRLGGIEETSQHRDPFAVAARVDPTARLTFGKSVGRDVDIAFSQGLRDADAQTWIVDYRPFRQVEFRFVSDDENLRSYEFRHDVSFGGATLAAPAVAVDARRRQEVAAVTISGTASVAEDRVRGVLDLEPGDEFDFALWQRDRDRVEALLRGQGFCEARVTSRHSGDRSVALAYSIVEGPSCAIDLSGFAVRAEAIDALRRTWAEAVFDDFFLEEARRLVGSELARQGHPQARVEASFVADDGRKTLVVRIDPGPRVAASTLRFEGVDGSLAAALNEWASANAAAARAVEDPSALERAVAAWLRGRGHLRARVTVGAARVEGSAAIVPITVDAGPALIVADVRVQGVPAAAVPDAIERSGIAPGMPLDLAEIEAARERLQASYRRDGFVAAQVDVRTSTDDASRAASVTFDVNEGARQVLREVQVSGSTSIETDVITRALGLETGKPVTVADWLQARRRIFDTGLFRRADVTPERIDGAAAREGEVPMRARVAVEEWPALRLRYGFEVAEERPEGEVEGRDVVPGASADLTRRTLFGRAVTVGAALQYQRREQSGRAFMTSRTMFGWPIESSLLVERSRETFASADLVTHLTGASWEQQVRAWRDVRLSYSYRFERNRTFRTDVHPDDDFGFDITVKLAWLNATAAWDTRDNVADTSRGWLLSSSFDWAPAALGTDFRFVKHLAQAYYFRPWRGVVFASAARVGIGVPLDDQDLVLSERYYAGGARTVRGVADDTLGPRFALGDPAGGESLLILNQEVRFPIYGWFRGVGFVDAGNVFAEAGGIDPGDLVASYGVGLRLATPFTLIRVDYGRLFSSDRDEPRGRWYFGIGQTF
jgi:outer membrane protein assembly factor BamA/autotransporter translocation and assembly factor TamB